MSARAHLCDTNCLANCVRASSALYGVFALSYLPVQCVFSLEQTYRRVLRALLCVPWRFNCDLTYGVMCSRPLAYTVTYRAYTLYNIFAFSTKRILNILTNMCSAPSIFQFGYVWLSLPSYHSVLSYKYPKQSIKLLVVGRDKPLA